MCDYEFLVCGVVKKQGYDYDGIGYYDIDVPVPLEIARDGSELEAIIDKGGYPYESFMVYSINPDDSLTEIIVTDD